MHCKHCGFANTEDEHRCLRCGRRLGAAVMASTSYEGATALAPEPDEHPGLFLAPAHPPHRPTQNVIPFAEIQRQAGIRPALPSLPSLPAPLTRAPRPTTRRSSRPVTAQEHFDFVPSAAPRQLKDTVDAQIYCDLPVATPMHRFVAGAMDGAMILIGFGIFMATAYSGGKLMDVDNLFGSGKVLMVLLAGALGLIAFLYGAIWVLARRETAGMSWSDLHLITFDGFPLDGSHRAVRSLATMMSFCSGGLGLLWALADAESLTWHDQISRTFPTVRAGRGSFVRQSRRR